MVPPPVHPPELVNADIEHPVEDTSGGLDTAVVVEEHSCDRKGPRVLGAVDAALGPERLFGVE